MSGDHEWTRLQDGVLLMWREMMMLTVEEMDPPEWQPPHMESFAGFVEDMTNDPVYLEAERRFLERINFDGDEGNCSPHLYASNPLIEHGFSGYRCCVAATVIFFATT